MGEEYRARVFKSGNSVALRLPKALGLREGDELRIVCGDRPGFKVEPVQAKPRLIDLTGIAGSIPKLKPPTSGEGELEHRPLVWDDPDWPGWKAMR